MKIFNLILPLLFLVSCQDKKKEQIAHLVSNWQGKEIVFPKNPIFTKFLSDTTEYKFQDAPYKVLIYIDSIGCTSCKLQLIRWKEMMEQTDSITGSRIPYLFFFHPKSDKEVTSLLKREGFNHPVCIDKEDVLNKTNGFPDNITFQTFLLDANNKVVVIGNPIHNPAVKELYIQQISNKVKTKIQITTTAVVIPEELNAGTIQTQTTKEVKFSLKNTGENPLVILDIATTCGCAESIFDKQPANPGETLAVTVKMTPKDKGFFDETITVKCNTNHMFKLKIKGNAI